MLARLRAGPGDELSVTEVPGGYTIARLDAQFEEQMKAARDVMARRRNALRERAK